MSMLKIKIIESLLKDLIPISNNNIMDKIDSNSKINKVKFLINF